ncbi:hypothetical protein T4D_5690 [Trichinella pseudospiralis]|uniref:Uncharacterized protein n=1 Tax=Trichinella pseudospiralis TaxID=6337 RepID=A0A0V1F9E1_TRIPS|nr:hypothetical protein T4D_5690 [Trichinella pseudospiralis]
MTIMFRKEERKLVSFPFSNCSTNLSNCISNGSPLSSGMDNSVDNLALDVDEPKSGSGDVPGQIGCTEARLDGGVRA